MCEVSQGRLRLPFHGLNVRHAAHRVRVVRLVVEAFSQRPDLRADARARSAGCGEQQDLGGFPSRKCAEPRCAGRGSVDLHSRSCMALAQELIRVCITWRSRFAIQPLIVLYSYYIFFIFALEINRISARVIRYAARSWQTLRLRLGLRPRAGAAVRRPGAGGGRVPRPRAGRGG